MASESDLEPIAPSEAVDLYIDYKETNCANSTVRSARYRLKPFVEWCEQNGIENLNDITGRDAHRFRMWRKETGDLKPITLRGHQSTLRIFFRWAESIEAVQEGLYDKILVPRVGHGERNRERMLSPEQAEEILAFLDRFHYASIEHLVIGMMWETAFRIGTTVSIDVDDIDMNGQTIYLKHRPDEGTPLKNGKGGERPVAISDDLTAIISDHIENRRIDKTDEYGRMPLLTTTEGRMHRSTLRNVIYEATAPHFRDKECPGCEQGKSAKCDEAANPHAIRRGSITNLLSKDIPVEVVSDRANVSRDVLDEHYDERSVKRKLEQRREYLDDLY